ncbi:hypothetical protein GCM10011610_66830 [Nocardia rhizosphaerihabitans]|uniref:Uncharacterized protein n=1 Tax=Nocardia rhizosphaerihabitans TaxID=1691570 RepID=A0ABQ2L2W2_9NOCA|nr:hypothetical protein GCM10011610_66830 [Nocardia rhizosphaerihabitans]
MDNKLRDRVALAHSPRVTAMCPVGRVRATCPAGDSPSARVDHVPRAGPVDRSRVGAPAMCLVGNSLRVVAVPPAVRRAPGSLRRGRAIGLKARRE